MGLHLKHGETGLMSEKRIIFIHGLQGPGAEPLPPKEDCLQRWRDALRKSLWVDIPDEASCVAYWADLRGRVDFEQPKVRADWARLRRRLRGPEARFAYRPDKLFIWARALIVKFLFDQYCRLVRKLGPLLSRIEQQWLEDYYLYFNVARDEIRGRLEAELDAAAQEGQRVAIVAHSMGTVIALDALYKKEGTKGAKCDVDLFVTMGSPLGLTAVQLDLTGQAHPHFPSNVRRWLNVFDGIDTATLPDRRLANDFTDHGMARIVDRMIRSNVGPDGKRDPHHWFGYLSCDEVGDAVSKFWIAD